MYEKYSKSREVIDMINKLDITKTVGDPCSTNNTNLYLVHFSNLCNNFKTIRLLFSLTMDELGDYIGYTKQTISNIERSGKISKTQYIAIRRIYDYLFKDTPKFRVYCTIIGEDPDNYSTTKWVEECVQYHE